jgi:hypothetical protein
MNSPKDEGRRGGKNFAVPTVVSSVLWSVCFYVALPGRSQRMPSANDPETSPDAEAEEIRAIVPPRAVLTELARGFLLVHESNPARARRFAETFLKEQTGQARTSRVEPVPQVTLARLSLGRFHRGAVEPTSWPTAP